MLMETDTQKAWLLHLSWRAHQLKMITRSSPVMLNHIPWNRRLRWKKRMKQMLMRKPVQRLMKLKRRIRRIIQRLKALAYKVVEVYLSIISKTVGRILQDIDDDIRTCCQEVGKLGKTIATLPETFKPQRTVKKIFAARLKTVETGRVLTGRLVEHLRLQRWWWKAITWG